MMVLLVTVRKIGLLYVHSVTSSEIYYVLNIIKYTSKISFCLVFFHEQRGACVILFKPCLSLTVDVTKDPTKTFERSENVKFLLLALVERGYISLKSKLSCGSSKRFPCVVLRVGFLGRIHGPMLCGCGRECTLSQHLGRMRTTRRRSLGRGSES